VYWPAILLSAGEPLPTEIFVHDYLTVDGRKISKSSAGAAVDSNDPVALVGAYGVDALRWWLLRDVPRVGDTDFTVDKLIARANEDLANGLGNLINRVVSVVHSYRNGAVRPCGRPQGTSRWLAVAADGGAGGVPEHDTAPEWPADAAALRATIERTPDAVRAALARYDFRAGAAAVFQIVEDANRYVAEAAPWHLATAERTGDSSAGQRLDQVLGALVAACQVLAAEIWPFLPDLAAKVATACSDLGGALPAPQPVFPRIDTGRASHGTVTGESDRQKVSEVA
jgi:methionyl-tRNA synthetase